MLSTRLLEELNNQIHLEGQSSQIYLSMAIWAETKGYGGVAEFMYQHSDEERLHMLKLIKYVNERGGRALVKTMEQPKTEYASLTELFQELLNHEISITSKINDLVGVCLDERDYTTHNFLQWYLSEQLEEEALARTVMDKIQLIDGNSSGLYIFDRDISTLTVQSANEELQGGK